jgi:hypothetical protein
MVSYTYTTVDPTGSKEAFADAINDLEQIAGSYVDSSSHYYGFLLTGEVAGES